MSSRSKNFYRKTGKRNTNKTIILFCEGETEKRYFDSFPKRGKNITVKSFGKGTAKLLEEAKGFLKKAENEKLRYNEKWIVFDKDHFTDFDETIKKSEDSDFKVAYSNPCFELWFFLHFEYTETSLDSKTLCGKVCTKLSKCQDCRDLKSKTNIYEDILEKQTNAIKNAKKLEKNKDENAKPSEQNPITKVHFLVESLNESIS